MFQGRYQEWLLMEFSSKCCRGTELRIFETLDPTYTPNGA